MRTAAQRRYAEKNKDLLRAKDTRRNHHNPLRDALNRNQRNSDLGWRWMRWSGMWQRMTFDYGQLSFISMAELDNPQFIFVYGGKRCSENLRSPLPFGK